ncbi:MAG: tyrosine--tRNA ligase [Fibrobacteres bacterium]|nr:tyrosine--tRNA ligase [Fibrobacterota bacterium]
MSTGIDQLLNDFARTTDKIFSLDELKGLLNSGRKLRIKYGVDVTAPQLHIGHAVNLWMMRALQDLGHKVIFLIGDYTTSIGDPTGKNKMRPIISQDEIAANTELFINQVKMVLRFEPEVLEIRRNSEWLDKLTSRDLLSLLSMVTHNRLLSRDMFQRRIAAGDDIYMHEAIYPILQGYDSVALESDLTIIGTDQLFNEMLGRFYQEKFRQTAQVILTTIITPGIDGKEKQSKSLGNYIALDHSPKDKFGRVMRMPDNLIIEYFKVYTKVSLSEIELMASQLSSNPMEVKKRLAWHIVERYHGESAAEEERLWFEQTFSDKQIPEAIPEMECMVSSITAFDLLKQWFNGEKSNSYIRSLISQGGMSVDGVKMKSFDQQIVIKTNDIMKIGKRTWVRLNILDKKSN